MDSLQPPNPLSSQLMPSTFMMIKRVSWIGGSSIATPHVAGLAAFLFSKKVPRRIRKWRVEIPCFQIRILALEQMEVSPELLIIGMGISWGHKFL